MSPLKSVEQHLADILAVTTPTANELLRAPEAAGRILFAPVRAAVSIPVFDNSAMDGFAVRLADVAAASPENPVTLKVVADLPAGTPDDPAIAHGRAARIMTGSAVPTDADAIVPFEDTVDGLADSLVSVTVTRAPRALGAHIRLAGEDARVDDLIMPAGIRLGALQLSAITAAGVGTVRVATRPRVVVVSTGSELVTPGEPLNRGQIPESNSVLLAVLAEEAGAEVVVRASVDDEGPALTELLARVTATGSRRADAVIFSGGVSAGAYEVVKNTLADTMQFSKVAMQPGKPQGFGRTASGTLLFGLPGNPVSAAVSFEMFVRPALLAMQGAEHLHRALIRLPAATGWRTPVGRRQYLAATIDRSDPGRWSVAPASARGSGSHLPAGLGRAEAYAVVPADVEEVAPGDAVDVMLLT